MVEHARDDEDSEAVLDAPGDAELGGVVHRPGLPQHCQEEQQDAQICDVAPCLRSRGSSLMIPQVSSAYACEVACLHKTVTARGLMWHVLAEQCLHGEDEDDSLAPQRLELFCGLRPLRRRRCSHGELSADCAKHTVDTDMSIAI